MPARPRVVIVGAGFGGLAAARALAGAPVDVLLLDRNNYHLFTPLLYQVATAGLEPAEIAHPVRSILRGAPNVSFRVAAAHGMKDLPEAMTLHDQILSRFEQAAWEQDPERRRAWLTFVVVGGGPTGV